MTVKGYPAASVKYGESVCVAGIRLTARDAPSGLRQFVSLSIGAVAIPLITCVRLKLGLVMILLRIACISANISSSSKYSFSPMP